MLAAMRRASSLCCLRFRGYAAPVDRVANQR
jgi:hypothetical protein